MASPSCCCHEGGLGLLGILEQKMQADIVPVVSDVVAEVVA